MQQAHATALRLHTQQLPQSASAVPRPHAACVHSSTPPTKQRARSICCAQSTLRGSAGAEGALRMAAIPRAARWAAVHLLSTDQWLAHELSTVADADLHHSGVIHAPASNAARGGEWSMGQVKDRSEGLSVCTRRRRNCSPSRPSPQLLLQTRDWSSTLYSLRSCASTLLLLVARRLAQSPARLHGQRRTPPPSQVTTQRADLHSCHMFPSADRIRMDRRGCTFNDPPTAALLASVRRCC